MTSGVRPKGAKRQAPPRGRLPSAAEADPVAAFAGRIFVAKGRANPGGVRRVPRAPPDDALLALRGAGGGLLLFLAVGAVVVGDPFPDVADHVLHPVARGPLGKAADRSGVREAVVD